MNSSHRLNHDQLVKMCKTKGLVPTKVIGTNKVQLSKGSNNHLDIITWSEFEQILDERNLAVYSQYGWFKIMSKNLP